MTSRVLLAFAILLFAFYPVFSQESVDEVHETDELLQNEEIIFDEALSEDGPLYIIHSFVYHVTGRTLPFVLNHKTELKTGEEIKGTANLEKFIQDKRQLLINERVLKDNVRIEYEVIEIEEGEKFLVDLDIFVEDTWNIIALPQPKYSSNSGLEITIKARDYNFLGTMTALRFDIGYRYDQEGRSYWTLMLDSGIPFELFGLNWHFDFENDFHYRPDRDKPYYFRNIGGLSVELPISTTVLKIGLKEHFIVNEENAEVDWVHYGEFQEGLYMSSRPYFSWRIPTGLEIGEFGMLTYTPGASGVFNHQISPWELSDNRYGATATVSHSLGFGRVNWIGNLKEGLSMSVSNSFSRHYSYSRNEWDAVTSYVGFTGAGYLTFTEWLGFSARLMYRHWFNSHHEKAGDVLRGIIDRDVFSQYMVSLNLDLPFRVLRFRPSEWFSDFNFMRIFDFDLQLVPVADIAFNQDNRLPVTYNYDNLLASGGLEMIVFPSRWRSLYFRISAGWDFDSTRPRIPDEIFLGMELFY